MAVIDDLKKMTLRHLPYTYPLIGLYNEISGKNRPRKKLTFEVSLVDHCNLNCRYCCAYAPLAEKRFIDVDALEKDLRQMKKIFGDKIARVLLLGGEPFLHPELERICKMARSVLGSSEIMIYTNGTLLLQRDEAFYRTLRDNAIVVRITRYPISFDYEKVKAYFRELDIGFNVAFDDEAKTMVKVPLDLQGRQNAKLNFRLCFRGNYCVALEDGKLYTCNEIAYARIFNGYFNEHLRVTERDYIDIYKETDAAAIFKKLATPPPYCRYCRVFKRKDGLRWDTSKRDKREWV